jgi:hypothetical protein
MGALVTACGSPSASPSVAPSAISSSAASLSASAAALQALIPDKIGTITVQKAAMSGEEFVGSGSASQEAQTFLQGLGVSADDVSVAIGFGTDVGSGSTVAMLLFRAEGASSDRLVSLFQEAANRDRENPLDWQAATLGSKTVERATDPKQGSGSIYLYARGVLLAFLTAGSDDIAAEALSGLP